MRRVASRPNTAPARIEREAGAGDAFRVVVRVRPENEQEANGPFRKVISVLDEHMLVFDPSVDEEQAIDEPRGARPRMLQRKARDVKFAFDRVFEADSTQEQVFEHTTKPIIDGVLEGYNASVFAYGATGAGKTHTMLGSATARGVMVLTVEELYRRIEIDKDSMHCEVAVSYLEVYNEKIRDLLQPGPDLAVREDGKGVSVSGLSMHRPKDAQELLAMLEAGNSNRTQHPTDANATSSRSHAVFCVHVKIRPKGAGLSADVRTAKMSLIDLAGSERGTATTNRGDRMREGANINRSLLALGNCINALTESNGKISHVPFRDSKLTRILKDSLGGNCRTVMIANVSPSSMSFEDTYNTLKYANRAKDIKATAVRNVVNVDFHITRYKQMVAELQDQVKALQRKVDEQSTKPVDPARLAPPLKEMDDLFGKRTALTTAVLAAQDAKNDRLAARRRAKRELDERRAAQLDDGAEAVDESTDQFDEQLKSLGEQLAANTAWSAELTERLPTEYSESELALLRLEYRTRALQAENAELRARAERLHADSRKAARELTERHKSTRALLAAVVEAAALAEDGETGDADMLASVAHGLRAAVARAVKAAAVTTLGASDSPAMHTRQKLELQAGPVPGTVTKGRAGTPLRALFNNLVDSPVAGSPSTPKLDEISGSLAAHTISVPVPTAALKAVRSVRVEATDDKASKKRVRISAPDGEENDASDGPKRSRASVNSSLSSSMWRPSETKRARPSDPPVRAAAAALGRSISFSAGAVRASQPGAQGRAARSGRGGGWH